MNSRATHARQARPARNNEARTARGRQVLALLPYRRTQARPGACRPDRQLQGNFIEEDFLHALTSGCPAFPSPEGGAQWSAWESRVDLVVGSGITAREIQATLSSSTPATAGRFAACAARPYERAECWSAKSGPHSSHAFLRHHAVRGEPLSMQRRPGSAAGNYRPAAPRAPARVTRCAQHLPPNNRCGLAANGGFRMSIISRRHSGAIPAQAFVQRLAEPSPWRVS